MEPRVFRQSKASIVFMWVVVFVSALAFLPLSIIVDWNSGLFPNFTTICLSLFVIAITFAALHAHNRRLVVDDDGIRFFNLFARVTLDVPWKEVKLVQYIAGSSEDQPYLILRVNERHLTFNLEHIPESDLKKVFEAKVPDRLIWP